MAPETGTPLELPACDTSERAAALDAELAHPRAQRPRRLHSPDQNGSIPFQWNWDSAFVAMGFATYDIDRAWRELETLFRASGPTEWCPASCSTSIRTAIIPAPPPGARRSAADDRNLAAARRRHRGARRLRAGQPDRDAARARLAALFPEAAAWHRWWHEIRDPDGTGLVAIVHPWETGRDNSLEWDGPLQGVTPTVDVAALRKDKKHVDASERPTDDFYNRVMTLVEEAKALDWDGLAVTRGLSLRVCDVGVQSILVRADRDLLVLARDLGLDAEAQMLERWIARSSAAFDRLRGPDGIWRSLDLRTGNFAADITS